jgi:uncharacterized protein (TIGR03437 family)
MQCSCSRIVVWGTLAAAFSLPALADLAENTVLQTNQSIDLSTGAVANSGGDLLWNGTTLVPQGSAKATKPGAGGETGYDDTADYPASYWAMVAPSGKSTPIAADLLVPGNLFAAETNSGQAAKVLILGNSNGLLSLKFTTFGAAAAAGLPTLTAVLNNSSQTPFGSPNYGIAPSSLFIVTGAGMADPGSPVLQSSQGSGIPLSLNGCSITVVVNGVTVQPGLYYTSPTQVAAVLPAATPVGTGTLTVTYRGSTSVPIAIQVVAAAVGFNSFNQTGAGVFNSNTSIGVATDSSTFALITFTNSAAPGETITLWSTGLGSDPADSDTTYTSTPHTVSTPLQVYFGGTLMNVLYAGASTYPGVNEIVFTLPQNILTGCYVPLVAVTGNIISNVVNLPVHAGGGSCFEIIGGDTGDQILAMTQNIIKGGQLTIGQTSNTSAKGVVTVSDSADASFEKYNGLTAAATGLQVTEGGCTVGSLVAGGAISLAGLDPGAIKVTGPGGLSVALTQQVKGSFYGALPASSIPATGGALTFTGTGGADVGSFTTTLTWTNPLFNWTNQSAVATIVKAQGFAVTWAGGNAGTDVVIQGTGSSLLAGNFGFLCRAPVAAGTFTVPPYILLGIPAGSSSVNLQNNISGTLMATGLDQGVATGEISFFAPASFQ